MAQPSIRQSFDRKLPSQIRPVSADYRPMNSTSLTTINEDPPRAYFRQHPNDIIGLVTQHRLPQNSATLSVKLPSTEQTHALHTEADVVRATYLYLVHPVNIAATRLMPNNLHLECRGEVAGDGSRTDIQWIVRYPNGQVRNIAVLEVKNTNVIIVEDFNPAIATNQNAMSKVNDAYNLEDGTLFRRNAVWLSKQAKKYHSRINIPHIALFDWNAMFIFDFSGMNEDAQPPVLARGAFMRERDNNDPNWNFRRFLFGFLIRALRYQNI